jgi:hypothetical protein
MIGDDDIGSENQSRIRGVAQAVGPEFKSQYHQKQTNKKPQKPTNPKL